MKSKGVVVYTVTGVSESTDHYGPEVFSKKPTDDELKKLAHEWDGDEGMGGPGDYGSYVYLTVGKTTIR